MSSRAESNGLGLAGFILAIVGLFTGGCLSPIALVLSFIGVFKEPRGFAIAGLVISLVAIGGWLIAMAVLGAGLFALVLGVIGMENLAGGIQMGQDFRQLAPAVERYIQQNDRFPSSLETLGVADSELLRDRWGNPYHYVVSDDGRTATFGTLGEDGRFGTDDDILMTVTRNLDGSVTVSSERLGFRGEFGGSGGTETEGADGPD